jgi:hypothetical protein
MEKSMNCLECNIWENYSLFSGEKQSFNDPNTICEKTHRFFDRLNIPQHEQFVLLKIASNRLSCSEFNHILDTLVQRIFFEKNIVPNS